jgi:FAD/FMN-containing dehydrogenase
VDTRDPALERLTGRINEAREQRLALDIRGGGTKKFYGGSAAGAPLDVTELCGITSYEPTELVVTARAGTRLDELEAVLQERGQCLPFEPPRFAQGGTVGGMVAAGLSGPARANAGSVRDHVLGATMLNGRGELLSFGGQVAKNVAGYDAARLLAGSLGIFGVICEVSIKVLPFSAASATLTFEWDEARSLAQLRRWAAQPLPINASAWHGGRLWVRLAGARAAVSAACTRLGGEQMAAEDAKTWWLGVRDQRGGYFALNADDLTRGEALWRLSVTSVTPALALPGPQFIEWGGALRWCRTAAPAAILRDAAARAGGHATLMRGVDKSAGAFAPLSAVLLRVHQNLKQAFDPASIFNPGRLYAGL